MDVFSCHFVHLNNFFLDLPHQTLVIQRSRHIVNPVNTCYIQLLSCDSFAVELNSFNMFPQKDLVNDSHSPAVICWLWSRSIVWIWEDTDWTFAWITGVAPPSINSLLIKVQWSVQGVLQEVTDFLQLIQSSIFRFPLGFGLTIVCLMQLAHRGEFPEDISLVTVWGMSRKSIAVARATFSSCRRWLVPWEQVS